MLFFIKWLFLIFKNPFYKADKPEIIFAPGEKIKKVIVKVSSRTTVCPKKKSICKRS